MRQWQLLYRNDDDDIYSGNYDGSYSGSYDDDDDDDDDDDIYSASYDDDDDDDYIYSGSYDDSYGDNDNNNVMTMVIEISKVIKTIQSI